MKEVFKYTLSAVSEYKKLLILGIVFSILSFIEMYPIIFVISYLVEKILFFSIGAMLIYLLARSKDADSFYEHIKIQPISTFLLHFLPPAMGIVLGNIILMAIFGVILYLSIYLTHSLSFLIMLNPHEFNFNTMPSALLISFIVFSVYFSVVSYIYLGKLGSALSKENFKDSFLEIISSAVDYKYLIKSFNKSYFIIFFVWSTIAFLFYSFSTFVFNLYVYPLLRVSPTLNAILFLIILSFASVIINYFTFISAYFANKSIKNEEKEVSEEN